MIANVVLQSTLDGLKQITHADFGVTEPDGRMLAYTAELTDASSQAAEFAASKADSQEVEGIHYFKIYDEKFLEYILVIKGEGMDLTMIGKLAAYQLSSLLVAYREKFDKDNFLKDLLMDNLLLVDIYSRAEKLRIGKDARRAILCIQAPSSSGNIILEELRNSNVLQKQDYPSIVEDEFAIVLHEMSENGANPELNQLSSDLLAHLTKKGYKNVRISFGTIVKDLKDVSRSYKEAKMALNVGKVFYEDQDIIAYSTLGIGRLIYQLPIPLCKRFIKEIFNTQTPDDFDEETLQTIDKFFENSLNVSETSRQLFIHRNTLVYRLDKIQKSTGLDLRIFEDAITFKIALMVEKYMKQMEISGY